MSEDTSIIDEVVNRARIAQQHYEEIGSQQLFDDACCAVGWALMEPERNRMLAELAVQETGLGNAADKVRKNHNKTLGLLRDLKGVASIGHIRDDDEKGLSLYYRPKGVIAAIVPSTNPLATPVNNIINALKTGNAIIIAPSPKGMKPALALLEHIHQNMAKLGISEDLVQLVPSPPSKAKTERLMQLCDMVVVTGSQNNVRAGYKSGTPAIGVGAGNVVTIIDETADIDAAAEKIAASKTFDNATSCSSENSVIALSSVYDEVVSALSAQGGLVLQPDEISRLADTHWRGGKMTPTLLAKDIDIMISELSL
ncbi:MAG: aldehyde dehydrogenase family protein, partial [Candidatus Puniceispirillaceae bacterium]